MFCYTILRHCVLEGSVNSLPYWGKKSRGKVNNFFAVTKFFPEENFPRPVLFPDFFSPGKEFIPIFFSVIINIIISYLFAKFIITMVSLCTLFIVVEQSSFNNNVEMRVKVNLKVKLVGGK